MMSLALAVSCTPGSCTTMRSAPCCCTTGSATPSSLTRLCKVEMFCLSADSWIACAAAARKLPTRRSASASPASVQSISGSRSLSSVRAAVRVAASRKRISTVWASRVTPAWRRSASRSSARLSPTTDSARRVSAACMSTCIRKCTPPRRSSPRYIGSAWMRVSHCGDWLTRLSATTNDGSAGSGLSARAMTSRARICTSVVAKRARTDWPSNWIRSALTPASLSAAATRASTAASTRTVALPLETWTAGASP